MKKPDAAFQRVLSTGLSISVRYEHGQHPEARSVFVSIGVPEHPLDVFTSCTATCVSCGESRPSQSTRVRFGDLIVFVDGTDFVELKAFLQAEGLVA